MRDFKERADYIVGELKLIQDAQGDGDIGALLDKDGVEGKLHFQELCNGVIKSGGFDLNGLWSPWYVEYKIFAGLRDAYRYTGNRAELVRGKMKITLRFEANGENEIPGVFGVRVVRLGSQ